MLNKLLVCLLCICASVAFAGKDTKSDLQTNDEGLKSADYYIAAGTTNLNKYECDSAISNFIAALALRTNDLTSLKGLGFAYFIKGDLDKALVYYDYSIRIAPDDVDAHLARGSIYRAEAKYNDALAEFNECLRLNPTNALAYYCRAGSYASLKEYDKSIIGFTRAIQLDSKDPKPLVARAEVYDYMGKYDKAIQDFTTAITIDQHSGFAYNGLAWIYATSPNSTIRNGKEAIEAAKTACNLTGWNNGRYLDTLAAAYAENGNFSEAADYERKAIKLHVVNNHDLKEMQSHLLLFINGRAYHDPEESGHE